MKRLINWHVPFVSLVSTIGLFLFSVLLALPETAQARPKITLPLIQGFYDGQQVFYINTEASDPSLAAADGTTFVPKLTNAIAANATADLFHITNFSQPNILDSVPYPVGPSNTDLDYSPLWQIHLVTWQPGFTPEVLTSEDAVWAAQAAGKVIVEATNIVVNCPIVATPDGVLPSAIEIDVDDEEAGPTITLPLTKGFARGNTIFYINTDASDSAVAAADGTNFVPKLANAHESGAEADLYPFFGNTNPAQRTVVDSAPNPVGLANFDPDYSPVWDVVPVSFTDQAGKSYPLIRSDTEIYNLVATGQMTAGPEPGIIVNCPILRVAGK
jgi:hypothetical protein